MIRLVWSYFEWKNPGIWNHQGTVQWLFRKKWTYWKIKSRIISWNRHKRRVVNWKKVKIGPNEWRNYCKRSINTWIVWRTMWNESNGGGLLE